MTEPEAGKPLAGEPLAGKVARGSSWLFGSYALSKLGRIGMMLVIAAMLSPADYGIIVLSAVILTAAQVTNELGVWQAVVHRSEPEPRFVDTAFTTNVIGGFVVATGLFWVAPVIAGFYGEAAMTGVLRVMGLALIADAVFYVPDGLLRKDLKFKSRALPEIAGTFGAALATVGLLLLGVGILSYAVGFVVESLTRCVLTLRKIDRRPRFSLHYGSLKEIASYAKYVLGADLARQLSSSIDYFIVGRLLGAGPLGFYTLAFNLANYPVSNFSQILSRIAFPTFATLQEDPGYARHVYLKMVRIVAGLVIPLLTMLALLAEPFVVGVLGEQWRPAIFPLQVMVVAGISRAISFPGLDLLRASGFTSLPFKVYVAQSLLIAGALLVFATRGVGTVAVLATAILSLASWIITGAACRTFGISTLDLCRSLSPGVALAASGLATVVFLGLLGTNSLPDILQLAMLAFAASVAMALCLFTAYKSFLREILALTKSGKIRKPDPGEQKNLEERPSILRKG